MLSDLRETSLSPFFNRLANLYINRTNLSPELRDSGLISTLKRAVALNCLRDRHGFTLLILIGQRLAQGKME